MVLFVYKALICVYSINNKQNNIIIYEYFCVPLHPK